MGPYWITQVFSAAVAIGTLFVHLSQASADDELFARLDVNMDGVVTADEAPDDAQRLWQRLLRTADKNNDGQLTREEFAAGTASDRPARPVPQQQSSQLPGAEQLQRLVGQLDKNRDGRIKKEEVPESQRALFARLIDQADYNKDGVLDRREIARGAPRLARLVAMADRLPATDTFFARLDANNDGKVTLSEVPAERRERLSQLIERADANSDGAIDKNEFTQAIAFFNASRRKSEESNTPDRATDTKAAMNRMDPSAGDLLVVLDKNGDGLLSAEEIAGAPAALKQLDQDQDGALSRDELARAGHSASGETERPRIRPETIVARMLAQDRDDDGRLSRAEAPDRLRPRFKDADTNGDGQLDRQELRRVAEIFLHRAATGQGQARRRLQALEQREPRPGSKKPVDE